MFESVHLCSPRVLFHHFNRKIVKITNYLFNYHNYPSQSTIMSEELELSATGGDAEFEDEGDGEFLSRLLNHFLIQLLPQSVCQN